VDRLYGNLTWNAVVAVLSVRDGTAVLERGRSLNETKRVVE
jgi:hypothetical protein